MSYIPAGWKYWRPSTILVHHSDAHGAELLDCFRDQLIFTPFVFSAGD
jgi:predicted short-subunit dehydrogenase-like oxidoreductase (DUF2520 family)